MAIDTPAELGRQLTEAIAGFIDGYANAYEMAYGPAGRGEGGGRSTGTSDRTGETAISNGYAKSQLRKATKRATAALRALEKGESFLGELFHEMSGSVSEDDPPPISITGNRFRKADDVTDEELDNARAAQQKRLSGITTVIPQDRFGVV